jgi:hypothetical protein
LSPEIPNTQPLRPGSLNDELSLTLGAGLEFELLGIKKNFAILSELNCSVLLLEVQNLVSRLYNTDKP